MYKKSMDEKVKYIGNFHKSLKHNQYGEVDSQVYEKFANRCEQLESGEEVNFNDIYIHKDSEGNDAGARFTNPQAGAATDTLGLNPKDFNDLSSPPPITSHIAAAEMVELYWMALLRDKPLASFATDNDVLTAVEELKDVYSEAESIESHLQYKTDLPRNKDNVEKDNIEKLDISVKTLFGCGFEGEDIGPRISQFFLQDIPYGVQTIDTRQVPYSMGTDFLITFDDWLKAQNQGYDAFNKGYGDSNNYANQLEGNVVYYPDNIKRHISTYRDMARFVNRDALHQSYFNAALFLDAIGIKTDAGNPYNSLTRSEGFATLGGPDLLTLVSEVASRALKVVWRQKWLVHRRCRPEVFGGMLEVEHGMGKDRNYNLSEIAKNSEAVKRVYNKNHSYLLPMAFSSGSPNHPAYGAGHATVAGACVTLLKAWFDEGQFLGAAISDANNNVNKDGRVFAGLVQPGTQVTREHFYDPQPYLGADADKITVGGELNKLASNVAMGRSIGGVHWRSDNTRSLRLGEQIAIKLLKTRKAEYMEKDVSFCFTSFDGGKVLI